MTKSIEHPFERALEVSDVDTDLSLHELGSLQWAEFILNPRRLRGSDFLMRWSQGVWSERRFVEAVNDTKEYFAEPYGPSGTAPTGDVRAFELYFERLEKAGEAGQKRPDLLIFHDRNRRSVEKIIRDLGGSGELPFTSESDRAIKELLSLSFLAVECENSLWVAKQMPDFSKEFRPQRRLGGLPGLAKSAVLPTIIVKDEDMVPLSRWSTRERPPLHIWHSFFDLAFGISFKEIERLISEGYIQPTIQVFQAPGGASSSKAIYKVYYRYAYPLAETISEAELIADKITDKNGHILPYVRFEGGSLRLSETAKDVMKKLANTKR